MGTVAGLVVAAGALGAVALEGLQDDENDSLLSRTPFGTSALPLNRSMRCDMC